VLDGHGWADLGVFKVDTTGTDNFEVTLSGLAGEQVAADAVRVIKVGPSAKSAFDGLGQLIAETDALGRTTSYEYDAAGFQRKVTRPDPDGAGPLAASYIERQFDVLGNITSQTNNLGETTSYQYDQLYRLTKETDPNSAETLYTYDLQGNLLSLSDPVGNVTSYTYDDLNRLVLEEITVDSQTLSRSTEYDLTGAVTRQVDRQGRVRDFTYDALHRRLSETWYANAADADSQSDPLNDIDTTYDAVDRLMAITDDFSDYAYTYDQLDRLLTTTASHPGMPEVQNNAWKLHYLILRRRSSFSPQSCMASKTGSSCLPKSVSEYSTLGGMCWWTYRLTMPSASNSRSCRVSVRAETPLRWRVSSPNRCVPSSK